MQPWGGGRSVNTRHDSGKDTGGTPGDPCRAPRGAHPAVTTRRGPHSTPRCSIGPRKMLRDHRSQHPPAHVMKTHSLEGRRLHAGSQEPRTRTSSGHVRGPSLSTKTGSPLAVPESQGLRRIPTPGPTHGCDREGIRAHPDPGIPGNCTPHTPPEIPEEGDSTTERLGGGRRCAPGPGRPPALA